MSVPISLAGPTEAIYYWLPIVVVIGGNALFFFFCQFKKDNSWIDVIWGLTFLTGLLSVLFYKVANPVDLLLGDNYASVNPRNIIVTCMIAIWSLRLAFHIGLRHKSEDYRYVDMRNRWTEAGGQCGYYWRAFVYVFMLQGLFSLINNSSALFIVIYSIDKTLYWTDYVGIAVWLFGFIFEWVGDEQLKYHLADRTPGKKKFI